MTKHTLVTISPAVRRAVVCCIKNAADDESAAEWRRMLDEIDTARPDIALLESAER